MGFGRPGALVYLLVYPSVHPLAYLLVSLLVHQVIVHQRAHAVPFFGRTPVRDPA